MAGRLVVVTVAVSEYGLLPLALRAVVVEAAVAPPVKNVAAQMAQKTLLEILSVERIFCLPFRLLAAPQNSVAWSHCATHKASEMEIPYHIFSFLTVL